MAYTSNEILISEDFITNFYKICFFIISNRNENHAIIRQQVSCHFQSRINHVEPVGMEAAVALGIGYKTVALLIELARTEEVFHGRLCKIVFINKVIACIIRRIYIYHFHLVEVGLFKAFQHIKVIALYVEVLRIVKVYTLLTAGTQSGTDGRVGKQYSLLLVRPGELIAFLTSADNDIREVLLQLLEIHFANKFARALVNSLRHAVWKERLYLLYIFLHAIGAFHS